jgi:hypothetical protein
MLEWIETEPDYLIRVITGDESWVFQYDPVTNGQSGEWDSPQYPRKKEARMSK